MTHFELAAALLRRGRVSLETLAEVEARAQQGVSAEDIMFREELLDLAPDIFPPHLVGAFLERNKSAGVREQDTHETYLRRMLKSRRLTTLRMITRQVHSAAKADATRRTTAVHPVDFNGVAGLEYRSGEEKYFVFPELFAEERLKALQAVEEGRPVHDAIRKYQQSSGAEVPTAFFEMMEQLREQGLGQQRDVKHKYPIHGLLYGDVAMLPIAVRDRMQRAGNLLLRDLMEKLPTPKDALAFSVDFFLSNEGEIAIGRDVHEQQIGMGLQRQLGVNPSAEFYSTLVGVVERRRAGGSVNLSYDPELCRRNQLYRMELAALRGSLESAGITVTDNASGNGKYTLRLFGGREGVPTTAVTALTDDKILVDDTLEKHRQALAELGVIVPATYRCRAAEIAEEPQKIAQALRNEHVFVHPTVHHGFKPFELDLGNLLSAAIVRETFTKRDGTSLRDLSVVVMERIDNAINFNGKKYAHEVRAYLVPEA